MSNASTRGLLLPGTWRGDFLDAVLFSCHVVIRPFGNVIGPRFVGLVVRRGTRETPGRGTHFRWCVVVLLNQHVR